MIGPMQPIASVPIVTITVTCTIQPHNRQDAERLHDREGDVRGVASDKGKACRDVSFTPAARLGQAVLTPAPSNEALFRIHAG